MGDMMISKKRDVQSAVSSHYQREYSCTESGCGEDGVCRCGKIRDPVISEVDLLGMGHLFSRFSISKTKIRKYLIYRLLVYFKYYDISLYDVSIVPGYYGEEIGSVFFQCEKELHREIEVLNGLSDNLAVEHLLKLEYGSVLPQLAGKNWSIRPFRFSDILVGNQEHLRRVDSSLYSDIGTSDIIGCVTELSGSIRLWDGYHRFSAAQLKCNSGLFLHGE